MAIFTDTPAIPFRAALRKYAFRFVALVLQPAAGAVLTAVFPSVGSYASGALFLGCAVAAGWPVAFKDAPISFWLVACLCWFVASLLIVVLASAAGVASA